MHATNLAMPPTLLSDARFSPSNQSTALTTFTSSIFLPKAEICTGRLPSSLDRLGPIRISKILTLRILSKTDLEASSLTDCLLMASNCMTSIRVAFSFAFGFSALRTVVCCYLATATPTLSMKAIDIFTHLRSFALWRALVRLDAVVGEEGAHPEFVLCEHFLIFALSSHR